MNTVSAIGPLWAVGGLAARAALSVPASAVTACTTGAVGRPGAPT